MLNNYLSQKFIVDLVKRFIKLKQDKYIFDPQYNQDMEHDYINITEKIHA